MEIKEITISRSARMNLGNYEGVEQFISMKAELQPGDKPSACAMELSKKIERALCAQLFLSLKRRGKKQSLEQVAKYFGLIEPEPIKK
jgi:hypothetical protein